MLTSQPTFSSSFLSIFFLVSHPLVRIVDGNTPFEGRVEVFHSGIWGTVCHNHWSIDDATVVCNELGFARAVAAPGYGAFGTGTGQVSQQRNIIILC